MNIYTDGAVSGNGYENSVGGWAFVIIEDEKEIKRESAALKNATNNQCELLAIINGCRAVDLDFIDSVNIYSDSSYCINCYNQKWYKNWQSNGWLNSKKQPVANKDLWLQLIPFFDDPRFNFYKVKGHSGNKFGSHSYWNNYVDRLAVEARSLI